MGKGWQAQWIIDPAYKGLEPIDVFHKELEVVKLEEHKEQLKNRHMLIRKKVVLKQVSEQAMLRITADDYYKLYINGRFVGQGPAPAYHMNYNYNQYDVSDYLVRGENVIAVHVYYQGLINRVWNSGDYRQGMIAELFVDDCLVLKTDKTWRYQITGAFKSCGITGYDTQYMEAFDSRIWEETWNQTNYDDSYWEFVEEHEKNDYQLQLQESENLSVYTIKPMKVEEFEPGRYLLDYGQEVTGQIRMSAQGAPGQVVEIRCGEELEADDSTRVRYKMRCNCDYQEFWTLSGKEDQLNQYDYKAFRYVEVIIQEGVTVKGDIEVVVRHYPFDDNDFVYASSNELVDQIIEICKNGVKYGSQEVYVDCPTREKGQYLGDFTVTGHSHIYLTGETDMYKKTLKDFANSASVCPGIMAVAPGGFMQEIAEFSMQWPMQLFQYYRQTGDSSLLEDMYETLTNLENYFKQYERADGLVEKVDEKWNLVDWPDNLRDGYDCELSKPIGDECHNAINAQYYGMLTYADKIRTVLGKEARNDVDRFKESFIKVFYNKDTELFVDREGSEHSAVHSNALPLLFDLFPIGSIDTAVELVKARAGKCGVQMSYFVLKALAKVGAYADVYRLIEELWSTMVEEGATTCYEAWGKDQKFNTSLCHPWASAPIVILVEDIIGLNPEVAGWEQINFTPHIPEHLQNFRLELKVNTGRIFVEKKDSKVTIKGPEGIHIIGGMTNTTTS